MGSAFVTCKSWRTAAALTFAMTLAAWAVALAPSRALAQDGNGTVNGELPGEVAPHPGQVTINGNTMAAKVTRVILPAYPKDLQAARVGGVVILRAIIAKDGSVKSVQTISGPAQLQQATIQAVKQWSYQPTLIEGTPVEVSTTISISFTPGKPPRYEQQGAAMPQTAEAMDPQLRADILRLIVATHLEKIMRDYGHQMLDTMRPSIEDSLPQSANRKQIMSEIDRQMTAALQSQEATDQIIMVYAKYLSDNDVKGAAAFYESPAGQRFNAVSTQMEDDLSQSGEEFAMRNLNAILKTICSSHPELRGKADFCGPQKSDSNQNSAFNSPRERRPQSSARSARGN